MADEDRKERAKPEYRRLADKWRAEIDSGAFAEGRKMPTEAALVKTYGVSRHTVREALSQLLRDGLIYRIQGSGTFVSGRQEAAGRYQRTIGSIDELIVWPDTRLDVLEPFETTIDASVAARLELGYIEVSRAVVRRLYERRPFVVTRHYVDPELGEQLRALGIPSDGSEGTVIGEAQNLLPHPVAGARQDITALNAPPAEAELIGCEPGDAILLVERLYYDTAGRFVELTASHFNPRRYTYQMELRRRPD